MLSFWNNPILVRELRVNTRCRKTLVMTLGLVMSLAALLALLWPRTGIFSQINSSEIFSVFLNLNLTLLLLIVPGFVATTITSERENRSFDLLVTSLLTPLDIMTGKLFASLALTFMVVIISMPITAVCALSGGISVALLLRAYSVILLATLTYGLYGLAVSAVCRRSFTALVLTYLGILFMAGATWLPSVLLSRILPEHYLWQTIRSLSPFEALFAMNHPELYELSVSGTSAEAVYRFHTLGMLTLSLLFLLIFCLFILRPPAQRRAKMQSQYTDRRRAIRRKLMFPFYLIDPLKRKKPIGLWRNPVYVAEIRSRVFGRPKFIVRSLALCIVLSLLILFLVSLQFATQLAADTVRVVAITFQIGVVAFLAPAVCSGSITDERTSGTLTMLRMTGVPVHVVVFGKAKSGLLYVLILLTGSLPVIWALSFLESQYWRSAIWVVLLVLTTVTFVAAGLCASTIMRTTAAATAVSYGFSALLCLGTFSVLLLGARIAPLLKTVVLSFNPIAAALQVTSDECFTELPEVFGNQLWQNNVIFLSVTIAFLMVVTAVRVRTIFQHRV